MTWFCLYCTICLLGVLHTRQNRVLSFKNDVFCHSYVAWQVHERVEGQYDFEGNNDLVNFTKLAGSLGLLVIVRAGMKKLL